jgi:diguanylate cyclase (GGDEF)-like protein
MDMRAARRCSDLIWTCEAKKRIRLQQWSLALAIYLACAGVMGAMACLGAVSGASLVIWLGWVLSGVGVFYVLIRSGWSERFADAALTEPQILFGLCTVLLGYWIESEIRFLAPIPLLVILNFGAFSLDWRRMAVLTAFSLLLLAATAAALHHVYPGKYDPMVDIAILLMTSVTLPATSVLAVKLAAMRSRLRTQRAELLMAVERIRELATRDELTGLANRRHAQQLMQVEFNGVDRTYKGFSVAMIDLDHFKRINDRCGHGGGDAVLQRFAEEASGAMRAGDVVCRWGGEEFLIFMPGTHAGSATRVVERLRERVEALRVVTPDGEATFTFSAGIAEHLPPESVSKMISRADAALYRAKAQGRNRVLFEEGVALTD